MPSTSAVTVRDSTASVLSSKFTKFCSTQDNCSLADNSSSCSDLSTDSAVACTGTISPSSNTSDTGSSVKSGSLDQIGADCRRLSLDDCDDSSSFPDDHFTSSGTSSPAGDCCQCEVDNNSHGNGSSTSLLHQPTSKRANADMPPHIHRNTHPHHHHQSHPDYHHYHHHSEDLTRSVPSLKSAASLDTIVSSCVQHTKGSHNLPYHYSHHQQSQQKSQLSSYDSSNAGANNGAITNKFNRFPRRNTGQGKKPRYYNSSFLNQSGYYPCNICCYNYSPLYDIANSSHYPGNNRSYRNRSFSASHTQQQQPQQHSEGVSAVLTLAECAYLYSNYRKRSSLYNLTGEEDHILNIGRRSFDLRDVRYDVLTFDQVRCLSSVLDQTVKIKSDAHSDVVEFSLLNLILAVKKRLLEKEIVLYDIRLNGGAASHVLSLSSSVYNDIDLIFFVDLKNNDHFERVREAVLEVLLEFVPTTILEKRRVIETFVNKMVKVSEIDRWSLISLLNHGARNVELKFVDSMRRQYEFSVDSFQVVLDTLLQFSTINSDANPMTYNFYPTVVGESMFGNFSEAMFHLHNRLIVTKKPEQIRGGGLLKYCNLLVRKFYPIDENSVKLLEPYMCTRFFIDFFYYECQRDKLKNYLNSHFENDSLLKYNFMIIFLAVIRRSYSGASHHVSVMHDFERLTIELYSYLLTDYFTLYLTNYCKVQEFFVRCQEIRTCHCPKYLRSCIHRYLNPVYSINSPIVVTYVDDAMEENVPKDERKKNLSKFIEKHDELFPLYGGFSFAFLPSTLFDRHEANHYVVSSSTLKNLPSSRFVRPEPPSADYLCTFLMKTTNNGQQPMIQIIPLGIQDLLPKSFHAIEYSNPTLITPSLAFHFFPPIAPPPAYRLCIVNRIPVYYSETIASGPIYNSQVISMHYPQPQAPPAAPQPLQSAQSALGSVSSALGDQPKPVNLSQFNLPSVYPHQHNPFHHHHHHHHPHHQQQQLQQQPQLPQHHNNNPHFAHPHQHHHHSHQSAPPSATPLPYFPPVSYFQHFLPPSCNSSPPRSKKSPAQSYQAQTSACDQIPPLEPLRIVYPRLIPAENAETTDAAAKPVKIVEDSSKTEKLSETSAATTILQSENISAVNTSATTKVQQRPQQDQTNLPFPIPQISINGNSTSLATEPAPPVKRSFAATTKANIHFQWHTSPSTNNNNNLSTARAVSASKHSQNGIITRKGAPSVSGKKKGTVAAE